MKIIRQDWPKVRQYVKAGNTYFSVDLRRKHYQGEKFKSFNSRDKALEYASQIGKKVAKSGTVLEMSQILDDGKAVAFGQSLNDIEQMFGLKAIDIPIRIARKGIDKSLKTENLSLEFDSGKLKQIQFESEYEFKNPPTPYPETWKNFPVIGATRISGRMSREEFLTYLKAWEERAKNLGAEPTEAGDDLTANQYAVAIMHENFMDLYMDMIVVNMGPSRRAGGGGLWCDGWILFFATETDHHKSGVEVGRFQSLSAFRDEFNTVARRISDPPRI